MNVLAENKIVALGRMLFVPKDQYAQDQLEIEATGRTGSVKKRIVL